MNDVRPTALITGATGVIGRMLVEGLRDDGYSVRALVRSPATSGAIPPDVKVVVGDLCDDRALDEAVAGVDIVFHLAAKLHGEISDVGREARADYERVNADGTRRLADASALAGVRRFVYFSTIAVYGPTGPGEIHSETSSPRPQSPYAVTKLRGEEYALGAPGAVVLRLAAVYGLRLKGNYRRLVKAIERGLFVGIGAGTNRRTVVHEHDVVRAALLAARTARAGSVYNVTDGRVHTVREISRAISSSVGRRLLPWHLPAAPVRFLVGVLEDTLGLAGGTSPIGRAAVDKLLEDVAVSGDKIQRELGFRPAFDLAAGWRQALANPRPPGGSFARSEGHRESTH
jgi:nucleoside-diphosphate-sugar epimerase